MFLFGKLKERFRDHARDDLCADLRALGIQAQMSERGRPEEKITRWRGKSFGIIDMQDALICWVDVKKGTLVTERVTKQAFVTRACKSLSALKLNLVKSNKGTRLHLCACFP